MKLEELLGEKYVEDMTLEQVEEALSEITLPEDNSAEIEKLKTQISKSNSEAAEWKRKHNALLSEEEAKKQKEEEEREELQKKYDKLLHDSLVSTNKAKLLGMGYEEKLAEETAEAMASGDLEKVLSNQKTYLDAFEKKIRADALKDTPKPTGDGDSKTMTLEKLRGMNASDRYQYSVTHPEEYKELYAGGKEE